VISSRRDVPIPSPHKLCRADCDDFCTAVLKAFTCFRALVDMCGAAVPDGRIRCLDICNLRLPSASDGVPVPRCTAATIIKSPQQGYTCSPVSTALALYFAG
jgi:hypothetical protein